MPKLKTHKGAAKRFSFTGTGKIKRSKAFKRHILNKKSRKTVIQLGKTAYVSDSNVAAVKKMLPYN